MAHVILTGEIGRFTGGETELDLEAPNIFQLFKQLGERYPELKPHLAEGFAVAIDGELYSDALFQKISADSEVQLVPKLEGG